MTAPIVLAIASATCFLGVAHAAVTSPPEPFHRLTTMMMALAALLVMVSPAAGAALLAPVLLGRRLANAPVPQTVDELLERYPN